MLSTDAQSAQPVRVPASSSTSDSQRCVIVVRFVPSNHEVAVSLASRATLGNLQDMLWRQHNTDPRSYLLALDTIPLKPGSTLLEQGVHNGCVVAFCPISLRKREQR